MRASNKHAASKIPLWQKRKAFGIAFAILAILLIVFFVTPYGRKTLLFLNRDSKFGGGFDEPLQIHVLDVGKADAIVLSCDGRVALIDGGTVLDSNKVVDYLERNNLGTPEMVICSHPDSDHMGGLKNILKEAGTSQFVRGDQFSEEYETLDKFCGENNIPVRIAAAGDVFSLGGSTITVLGPQKEYVDTNNSSLVLKLEYDGFSALFCGDIEERAEEDLLESGENLSADLLKVPHHGSRTSSSEAFLEEVNPRYAVVSVGKDNNNLPNDEPLDRLDSFCDHVFRTDLDGNIVFGVDGGNVSVYLEN